MRAARDIFRTAPLFEKGEAPHQQQKLEGYAVGDFVWLSVPGTPGARRRAKVITILPKHHNLILRADCPVAIVQINPFTHGALLSKRNELE
jgi:hypothetical protein